MTAIWMSVLALAAGAMQLRDDMLHRASVLFHYQDSFPDDRPSSDPSSPSGSAKGCNVSRMQP
jgi:hypothetical protein